MIRAVETVKPGREERDRWELRFQEVTFRPEGVRRRCILGRGHSRCRGPEVGMCFGAFEAKAGERGGEGRRPWRKD